MSEEVVLKVENLSICFYTADRVIKAVDAISFEVRAGSITAIVGESGCGKTVTAKAILGLLEPPGQVVTGEIWLKGKNIYSLGREELRQLRGKEIAMIFQDPQNALNPVLPIETQMIETFTSHQKISREQAKESVVRLLDKMGLPNPRKILSQYPFQLSGGMCQRIMIAIAIALNPALLIADEPTTALDVTVQAQILRELHRLKEEMGVGIMLITHDLGVVAEIADRVYIMKEGKILESGSVYDIFQYPQHIYTKKLINSILSL